MSKIAPKHRFEYTAAAWRDPLVQIAEDIYDNQPDGFKSEDADAIKEQGGSA